MVNSSCDLFNKEFILSTLSANQLEEIPKLYRLHPCVNNKVHKNYIHCLPNCLLYANSPVSQKVSFLYLDISDIEGGVEKVVRVVIKEWIDFFKSFSVALDVVYTSGDVFILILLNVIKLVILF